MIRLIAVFSFCSLATTGAKLSSIDSYGTTAYLTLLLSGETDTIDTVAGFIPSVFITDYFRDPVAVAVSAMTFTEDRRIL